MGKRFGVVWIRLGWSWGMERTRCVFLYLDYEWIWIRLGWVEFEFELNSFE